MSRSLSTVLMVPHGRASRRDMIPMLPPGGCKNCFRVLNRGCRHLPPRSSRLMRRCLLHVWYNCLLSVCRHRLSLDFCYSRARRDLAASRSIDGARLVPRGLCDSRAGRRLRLPSRPTGRPPGHCSALVRSNVFYRVPVYWVGQPSQAEQRLMCAP